MNGGHRRCLSAELLPKGFHRGRPPEGVRAAETPELFADTLSKSQAEGWQLAENLRQDFFRQLRLQK